MSFDFHHADPTRAALASAILIYGSRGQGACYATVHEVRHGEGRRPEIAAGVPATREGLLAFAEALSGAARVRHGLLPPEVLSAGNEHLVWWVPPAARTIHFKSQGALGKRSGAAPHPGLVFAVHRRQWYVVAVKGRDRPVADTPTFHAPYMNVWELGEICTGSVALPEGTVSQRMAEWVDAFFKSYFTHPNHPKAVKHQGGLDGLWGALLDANPPRFPDKSLVRRQGETVGRFIDMIEGAA